MKLSTQEAPIPQGRSWKLIGCETCTWETKKKKARSQFRTSPLFVFSELVQINSNWHLLFGITMLQIKLIYKKT